MRTTEDWKGMIEHLETLVENTKLPANKKEYEKALRKAEAELLLSTI